MSPVSSSTERRKPRTSEVLALTVGFVLFLGGLAAWFADASWFYVPILLGLVIGQLALTLRMVRR